MLTFLESVGRRSEAELYLQLFRRRPKASFAVLVPEANLAEASTRLLAQHLSYLARLGLFAPVLLGLFHPESAERVAEKLVRELPDVPTRVHGDHERELARRVVAELEAETVPIVVGSTRARQMLTELVGGTRAPKVVFIGRRGLGPDRDLALDTGVRLPVGSAGISVVNLRTDYEPLIRAGVLDERERELLELARELIAAAPERLLVSITSPLTVLHELFTERGAGTLVKPGSNICRHAGYAEVDRVRLRALLEASFARPLSDSFFDAHPVTLYLEEAYRGAAVLTAGRGADFLTKFAVDPVARGEGIGRDLWQAMVREHPRLYWRARPDNPISAWYLGECDGMVRTETWQVFWRGVPPAEVTPLIDDALARSEDFPRTRVWAGR